MRLFVIMALTTIVAACSGESQPRGADEVEQTSNVRTAVPSTGATTPLCERIEDDEALTPSGAEPLAIPGIREANSSRRCLTAFGVDSPIGNLRGFYRSTLGDLGYEITIYQEGEGIVRGNLSRTLLRAMKPAMQVNLQIDEFDPSETTLAGHTANVKLQIDEMRD